MFCLTLSLTETASQDNKKFKANNAGTRYCLFMHPYDQILCKHNIANIQKKEYFINFTMLNLLT